MDHPKRGRNRLKDYDYRSLKGLVTKAVGRPVFQRSFCDHVVRNEADALRIRQYIWDNPAKWQQDRFYQSD